MFKRRIFIVVVGVSALLSIWFASKAFFAVVAQPINVTQEQTLDVARGEPLTGLLHKLDKQGLIENSLLLKLHIRLLADEYPIKQGHYSLVPGASLQQLLADISAGKEKTYRITLVEGLTWQQWRNELSQQDFIHNDLSDEELLTLLDTTHPSLEGLLLPETYDVRYQTPLSALVVRMYDNMQRFLQEQWANRQGMLPVNTPYEALILASIIEKETGVAEERPRISGVFVNRLRDNMRLQTDPTVIYGIGSNFDGNLTRAHLRQSTPYNTYVIKGLPPTPIAMASKESIVAALNPAMTEEYYFVSKGDGSHQFSETLQQHNAAVRKYQLGL
ncbi:endolytic transglycosylase MltG [Planctobacterium marinum]|uniref:endolytic transglycosylase MltG n=1 Tax=Planctobacterium marinum TaxID=1631968 RepID=UPI001E598EBA|nr:endolytic transglycosylase MltG [Planctobacterium marinum]MCC2604127.1 endolytic transglycosylase MltG [Planctobacterium marinum]